MDVTEAAAGDGDGLKRCGVLAGNFATLTMLAISTPGGDVGGHAFPEPSGSDQPPGCSDARMGQPVNGGEDFLAVGLWYQGS